MLRDEGGSVKICISLSLKGALTNWKKKDFKNVLQSDDGKYLSPEETKQQFLDWLAEGKLKVPFGECDNFDYIKGCRGHE